MKKETLVGGSKAELKHDDISFSSNPSRVRAFSKVKEPPKFEGGNGSSSTALKARSIVNPDVKINSKIVSGVVNKPKSGEFMMGSQKGRQIEDVRVKGRPRIQSSIEQIARPRLQRAMGGTSSKRSDDGGDGKKHELKEKLDLNESLIKNLQSEVFDLKTELDKARSLNMELQSQNRKLSDDLAAAEGKIAAISNVQRESIGEYQSPKFKDIQKLIANKLENSKGKKEVLSETSTVKTPPPKSTVSLAANAEKRTPAYASGPPPPPPPLPSRPLAKVAPTQKGPTHIEFYCSLTKQMAKKDSPGSGNHNKPASISAHSSIVGEIQNRSAHLLAIKMDIETKGEFINGLIQKVLSAAYTDIEHVLKFMDWLDGELLTLADERAVLKHFKWPERKADAMREAAIEYRELKLLENEISSYKDNTSISCGDSLKKMASLLDKSERSIQRLIKLRNSVLRSYQELQIPTDWMLDSGIMSKIKQVSMKLAKMYMKRLTMELESVRYSNGELNQEALLLQGLHFAQKAHQFAGGLDSETLCAFEEIRQRVPGHLGGSRELLSTIPSL